jgi:hypothetical protein
MNISKKQKTLRNDRGPDLWYRPGAAHGPVSFEGWIMIELPKLQVQPAPFDHAVQSGFLPPALYADLTATFPTCPPLGGPTGFSYFAGDADYDRLIATNPAWSTFTGAIRSQAFIDYCLTQLGDVLRSNGCLIDLDQAYYADFHESRAEKARRHIQDVTLPPEALWIRTDILQGRTGYGREAHLDHRRRLITVLIYFCDAMENQMEGGSVILQQHRDRPSPDDIAVAPAHNLMVAFPCSPNSFHSVSRITSQSAPRNFVQITVSSSVDAWPAA